MNPIKVKAVASYGQFVATVWHEVWIALLWWRHLTLDTAARCFTTWKIGYAEVGRHEAARRFAKKYVTPPQKQGG
jgi:hypothetical protein